MSVDEDVEAIETAGCTGANGTTAAGGLVEGISAGLETPNMDGAGFVAGAVAPNEEDVEATMVAGAVVAGADGADPPNPNLKVDVCAGANDFKFETSCFSDGFCAAGALPDPGRESPQAPHCDNA